MSDGQRWRRLLRITFNKGHASEQVDDELRFHIESLVERLVSQGKSEEDARREVMARFGSYMKTRSSLVRAAARHTLTTSRHRYLDGARQDLRLSLRSCLKHPGFSGLVVLILALGIGACSALFSVVDSVLLNPLPFPESKRLVHIGTTRHGGTPGDFTTPEFRELHANAKTLESYAAYRYTEISLRVGQEPGLYSAAAITKDYFDVFGIHPFLGRAFVEEDFDNTGAPTVILSFGIWQQQFGADPDIVGTAIATAGRYAEDTPSVTIVGVMPRGFTSPANIWVPERMTGTWWEEEYMFTNWTHWTAARLADDYEVEDANAEVETIAATLAATYPQYYGGRYYEGRSIGAVPLLDHVVLGYRSSIWLLFGAACLLLFLAIASLSGMYLARALDRRQEIAVRSALGASRGRIGRQLVTEAILTSLIGSVLGTLLAAGGVQAFRLLAPAGFPRLDSVSLDLSTVVFACILALLSGLLCGVVPLVLGDRTTPAFPLHSGTRASDGARATRLRGILIGAQVALTTYLLVGAGLLANNFWRLQDVHPGVQTEGLLVMPIQIPDRHETAEEYTGFLVDVVRRVNAVPGVVSASWTPDPPMYGGWWHPEVVLGGMARDDEPVNLRAHPVGPDFFQIMGIPILDGRGISEEDASGNRLIAVVDEIFARRFFPSRSPLGARLRFDPEDGASPWHTIVGVVGSTRIRSLAEEPMPQVYVPALQRTQTYAQSRIVIRSALPATNLAPMLQDAVWQADPNVPVPIPENIEERISADMRDPRFHAVLLGFFSLSAAAVTLSGIYGLMSYVVTGRTREIGIRSALGAGAIHVLWTVSRPSFVLIFVGLAAGIAAAAGTSRLLGALLFAITPLDVPTFGFVAGGLGLTALFACLVPAWRATRIEPTETLRWE